MTIAKSAAAMVAAAIASATAAKAASETDIIVACVNTVNAYAHARDAVDGDAMRALFVEDAGFEVFGRRSEGVDAIIESMEERGANAASRHLVTSVHVAPGAGDSATGVSYSLVVRADDPLSATSFDALVRYEDEFALIDGACLFKERKLTVTLFDADGE